MSRSSIANLSSRDATCGGSSDGGTCGLGRISCFSSDDDWVVASASVSSVAASCVRSRSWRGSVTVMSCWGKDSTIGVGTAIISGSWGMNSGVPSVPTSGRTPGTSISSTVETRCWVDEQAVSTTIRLRSPQNRNRFIFFHLIFRYALCNQRHVWPWRYENQC